MLDAVPQTLSALAGSTNNPASSGNPTLFLGGIGLNPEGDGLVVGGPLGDLLEGLTGSQTLDASTPFDALIRLISPTRLFTTSFKDIQGIAQGMMPAAKSAMEGVAKAAEASLPVAVSGAGLGSVGAVGGAVGKAASVGGLSIPAAWASPAPTAPSMAVALNGATAAGAAGRAPVRLVGCGWRPPAGRGAAPGPTLRRPDTVQAHRHRPTPGRRLIRRPTGNRWDESEGWIVRQGLRHRIVRRPIRR